MAFVKRGIGHIVSIVPEQEVKEEDVKKALLAVKTARESFNEKNNILSKTNNLGN